MDASLISEMKAMAEEKLGIADLNDFEAIFTKLLEHLRDTLVELKATYG